MKNKIGTYLRQHREENHLTLEQVAEHTGIREPYLAALEDGDFHKIPGDVFIRGFLRNYGNYLGLDGNGLVEAYRTGSEPEKILKTAEHLVPEPELPKSSDTMILGPKPFSGTRGDQSADRAEKPAAEAGDHQPEPFDKVQALKQMEPVGFGGSLRADRKETAPQDPVKESMDTTRVMKPVKPAPKTEPVPEKPDPVKEASQPAEKKLEPAAGEKPAAAPVEKAVPEKKSGEKTPEQPAKEEGKASDGDKGKGLKGAAAGAAAVAAADAGEKKKHETPREALKKMETTLNRENMEEALDASKAKMGSWLDRIRDFIDENLYETVPEDEAGEEYGATSAGSSKTPAFSFKVFTGVFVACLAVFTVVMAYFVFGGKTTPDLKETTSISDGVKSDHSSEKSDKDKKEAEEVKEKQEEATGDEKTLGQGNGVTVVVTYKKPVWTQTTIDGKQVEAATIAKGSTRTYKGSKSVSVNLGSIRDVEITVNGKKVPYGSKEWGVVTRTFKAK